MVKQFLLKQMENNIINQFRYEAEMHNLNGKKNVMRYSKDIVRKMALFYIG